MYLDLKVKTASVMSKTVIVNSPLTLSTIKRPLKVSGPKPHKLNSSIMVLVETEKESLINKINLSRLLEIRTDSIR